MFSDFWFGLAEGSSDLNPGPIGSAAVDGLLALPSYVLWTLGRGAELFAS